MKKQKARIRLAALFILIVAGVTVGMAFLSRMRGAEVEANDSVEQISEPEAEADAPVTSEAEEPEEEVIAEPVIIYDIEGVEEFVRPDLIPAIEQICEAYHVCPELVEAMIEKESGGIESVDNTLRCIGLMGVSEYWNADRMERLNAMNLYDGRQNILVGVDLLAELFADNEDPFEVLDFYGGWEHSAKGQQYISETLDRAHELEQLHDWEERKDAAENR